MEILKLSTGETDINLDKKVIQRWPMLNDFVFYDLLNIEHTQLLNFRHLQYVTNTL